jgi:hypothetical protein
LLARKLLGYRPFGRPIKRLGNIKMYLRAVDCVGSRWKPGLGPMADFGISDVEPSGPATTVVI